MGCHTWFYKKLEMTQEEAKKNCLKSLRESEELNLEIIKSGDYTKFGWEIKYLEKLDAIIKRQIRMVSNDYCKRAVWNRVEFDNKLSIYVDGKGFYVEADAHDLFRRGLYPDDKLFSYEETISYIEDPKNQCQVFEYTYEGLRKFWDECPDGLIEFG